MADLLQVGREHDHRHEHGPLLDLAAEAEDGVLLEALLDVEDVLVLERDEADLLQPPHTGLLDELHHRLRGSERGAKFYALFGTVQAAVSGARGRRRLTSEYSLQPKLSLQ